MLEAEKSIWGHVPPAPLSFPSPQLNPQMLPIQRFSGLKLYAKPPVPVPPPPSPNAALRLCVLPGPGRGAGGGGAGGELGGGVALCSPLVLVPSLFLNLPTWYAHTPSPRVSSAGGSLGRGKLWPELSRGYPKSLGSYRGLQTFPGEVLEGIEGFLGFWVYIRASNCRGSLRKGRQG